MGRGGQQTAVVDAPSDEYRPFPNEDGRNYRQDRFEIPALVRALQIPVDARLLEVGCGRGIALPGLERLCRPTRLVGLDFDAKLRDEAERNLREVGTDCELVHGDIRDMPFADSTFDVVVDFGTLFHIARPADGLAEIARVLSPGGLLVEETKLSQLLSHPFRSRGRDVPWESEPRLRRKRFAALWTTFERM